MSPTSSLPSIATARLPRGVLLGPCYIPVVALPRCQLLRAADAELAVDPLQLCLATDLSPLARAEHFLRLLLVAGHQTNGLTDRASEEQFAQSFATSLLSFALANGSAWRWLATTLAASAPRPAKCRPGLDGSPFPMPVRIALGAGSYAFSTWTCQLPDRPVSWGWVGSAQGAKRVRLRPEVLAVHSLAVWLHELAHVLHRVANLTARPGLAAFAAGQASRLLEVAQRNPAAWAWLREQLTRLHRAAR